MTAAIATFAAVCWWSSRVITPGTTSRSDASAAGSIEVRVNDAPAGPHAPRDSGEPDGFEADAAGLVGDDGLQDLVAEKYRFLLADVEPVDDLRARVEGALLARESIAVAINTTRQDRATSRATLQEFEAALMRVDSELIALLPAGLHRSFTLLKDSDMEQFQLDEYAAGMAGVTPLDETTRRAVLFAKLEHREPFREMLASTGFLQMRAERRRAALPAVTLALEQGHAAFLASARQHIADDEQFALLKNYETTEFRGELRKLRELAEEGGPLTTPGPE